MPGRGSKVAGVLAAAALFSAALAGGVASARTGEEPMLSPVAPVAGPDLPGYSPKARNASKSPRRSGIGRKRLGRELTRSIDAAGSGSGVWVAKLRRGGAKEIFERRQNDSRILASNMKLFTTAAILDELGAKGRLRTTARTGGTLEEGILRGNLFLVGDGDPALSSRSYARRNGLPSTPLARLAGQIEKAGIKRVKGDVLADDTVFDRVRGVPDSGGSTSPWIGPLSGLSYNSNRRGGGFVYNPEQRAAEVLRKGLRKRGVKVTGGVGVRKAPNRAFGVRPLAAVRSPRLESLVLATNRPSNNFFAEMLLKRLDAADGDTGTTKGGAGEVESFARSVGSGVQATDGSGLTRTNRASAQEVGKLLVAMADHRARGAFRRSLPKAGRHGTLAFRMRGTAAEGRCRAKTGTISGVSSLSGYCRAKRSTLAFSILMNNVNTTSARSLQDRMAIAMARFRG